MKNIFPFLIVIYLASCTSPQKSENNSQDSVQHIEQSATLSKTTELAGTYSYGEDPEKEPTGNMMIYPKDDTTVLFNIDLNVGPPSYNSGQLFDTLTIKNNQAIYYKKEDGSDNGCKWQIDFLGDAITIKTLDNAYDCGFGGNVFADGTYNVSDHQIPVYFITMEGDTTYFNK
ncbi:hypothetical protein [Parapedobacter tibetensis]|uniref:hypothetical protein n=1 Tax=Parapedobacter tibetensis TaxID=2972951 RepID=UPI00214DB58F|nr:hypothetical protein [Parapedobacter tibetensis]